MLAFVLQPQEQYFRRLTLGEYGRPGTGMENTSAEAAARKDRTIMDDRNAALSLLCRVQTRLCALPLEYVLETMRPLPIEPLSGAPKFVLGLAIIRGELVPVIDAAALLGAEEARPARFVTVKAGARRVALAVDSVVGVRPIPAGSLQELPPLLGDAATEIVSAIGILDAELLLVLHNARLVLEDVRSRIDADGAPQ